jgi:hypothetical protein
VKEVTTSYSCRESNKPSPEYVTVLLRREWKKNKTEEMKADENVSHGKEEEKNADEILTRQNIRKIRKD